MPKILILKRIPGYHLKLGTIRLIKLLYLVVLAKLLAHRFPNLIQKFLPLHKFIIPKFKHPVFVRAGTTDIEALQQVLLNNEYELSLPAPPAVIIDAGANIGMASVYFATVYPQATIIALEPDKSNFELLKRNTASYPNVKARHAALWNENRMIKLFNAHGGHWGFQTHEQNPGALESCGEVQAMTIDRMMETENIKFIDLLKIDIEGAEREVFQDAAKWINQVGTLMVELHDLSKPGCSEAFNAATKKFDSKPILRAETTILYLRETVAA